MMDVNAVVILYNPDDNVIDNILSYATFVKKIYIYDNSPVESFVKTLHSSKLTNYEYIYHASNIGLAVPINEAAKQSIHDDIKYLLTMDQDSFFVNFYDFIRFISCDLLQNDDVGIYSPFHNLKTRLSPDAEFNYMKSVMTSGNIINLNVFFSVGGCDERYFIDCIDHDLCAKIIFSGKKIKQVNSCTLNHELGNNVEKKFGVEVTNHSSIRRYYMTRNTLYLVEKFIFRHPLFALSYFFRFIKNTIICLVYEKNRLNKLKYIIKGINHYFLRVVGVMK